MSSSIQQSVAIARALADPGRVRILMCLDGQELCACQITELLGLAPSTVSRHLSILAEAGLVAWRKAGRWVHYRLPTRAEGGQAAREALAWLRRALAEDAAIGEDARRLERILRVPAGEICRRQLRRHRTCCEVRSPSGSRARASRR